MYGKTNYSEDEFKARAKVRVDTGAPTFKHHDDIRRGKVARAVHASLSPRSVTVREARDSDLYPETIPVSLGNDLTGSMQSTPIVMQAEEPKLMGMFLKKKVEDKRFIGSGYPAIQIAGIDDYEAIGGEGALQLSQFEHDIKIDEALTNLWLTGMGGNNEGESYDLWLYALARKTQFDHWDKRHKKGHAILLADEPFFQSLSAIAVKAVFGDVLQGDIPMAVLVHEVMERWHLNILMLNQTSHFRSPTVINNWKRYVPEQHIVMLEDPTKMCNAIVSIVAMSEGASTLGELVEAGIVNSDVTRQALVPLSKATAAMVKLPAVGGAAGGTSRL